MLFLKQQPQISMNQPMVPTSQPHISARPMQMPAQTNIMQSSYQQPIMQPSNAFFTSILSYS